MNDNPKGQSFSSLPRPQKTAVIVLSIAAVGILGVWFWQFNMRLNNPFRPSSQEIAQGEKAAQDKIDLENASKSKDSDTDGLSDYDETNTYNTSPYLEDTDGDNISDFNEIKQGKDPLCAEGANCSLLAANPDLIPVVPIASSTENVTSENLAGNVDDTLLIKALRGEGDASTMRQILIQGGADPEQVAILTDEDLMTMYADILKSQSPGTVITSTTTATSSNINQ